MSARNRVHGRRAPPVHRFRFWPATRLGWLAVALAVASVALTLGWKLISPAGALPGLSCGFAGGVAGLAAIFGQSPLPASRRLSSRSFSCSPSMTGRSLHER